MTAAADARTDLDLILSLLDPTLTTGEAEREAGREEAVQAQDDGG